MRYIEAPNRYISLKDDPSVFLAGGITNCPDWQAEARELFRDSDYTVYSPRRQNFPMDDPLSAKGQITWEHTYLRVADEILFWFPKETLCPIVLYELGAWSMTSKPITVGIEPGYQREQDVRIQTALARPEVPVVSTLEDLVNAVLSP